MDGLDSADGHKRKSERISRPRVLHENSSNHHGVSERIHPDEQRQNAPKTYPDLDPILRFSERQGHGQKCQDQNLHGEDEDHAHR
mmetsp:Transcript_12219/g.26709  ORF Transcript_12219/g.26709 Transcript_12219/m.26709 type:complete len:85 (+) Transcript_12219:2338-2592(+)